MTREHPTATLRHHTRLATTAAAMTVGALMLVGCSPDSTRVSTTVPPASSTPSPTTPEATPQPAVDPATIGPVTPTGETAVIATGLNLPWSMVRLETESTLVSERDTALVKEVGPDGSVREVGQVPDVVPGGEGGLLGLAVLTDDLTTWLYAYTTTASDNRVVRMTLTGAPGSYALGAAETVFSGIPKAGNHNGGRLGFGPDGMLYATAGDASQADGAQDPAFLGGKILRIEPDGDIPSDNPFPDSPVWSLGHRNPQGIAWDADGQLWAAEFGQNTWDEFNRIEAGANYGWPVVEGAGGVEGFVDPVYQWPTSEASPSGLAFTSETFFLAALRGQRVWALYTEGETAATAVPWFAGAHGRIRDAVAAPDGSLWILTSNTDRNGSSPDGGDSLIRYELGSLVEG